MKNPTPDSSIKRLLAAIETAPSDRHRAIWQEQVDALLAGADLPTMSTHGIGVASRPLDPMVCPRCGGPTSVGGQNCGECYA